MVRIWWDRRDVSETVWFCGINVNCREWFCWARWTDWSTTTFWWVKTKCCIYANMQCITDLILLAGLHVTEEQLASMIARTDTSGRGKLNSCWFFLQSAHLHITQARSIWAIFFFCYQNWNKFEMPKIFMIEGDLFRPLQSLNWYFEILHAVMDIIIIAYDLLGIHSYHD